MLGHWHLMVPPECQEGAPRDLLHEFAREITIIDNLLTRLTANSTIVLEWIDT